MTVLIVTVGMIQGTYLIFSHILFKHSNMIFLRCGDPFNYTLNVEDMPAMKKCEGCCVKLVQNIGTPMYSVRRTCTDDLGKYWKFCHLKSYFSLFRYKSLAC